MENLRFIKSDQIKEIIDNNSFIAVWISFLFSLEVANLYIRYTIVWYIGLLPTFHVLSMPLVL